MDILKVLLIDADPQADLTTYMGWHNTDKISPNISTLMRNSINDEDINSKKAILNHNEGVDLLPANLELATMEVSLVNAMTRKYTVRNCLFELKKIMIIF